MTAAAITTMTTAAITTMTAVAMTTVAITTMTTAVITTMAATEEGRRAGIGQDWGQLRKGTCHADNQS